MASFREIILRTVGDGESARRDLKQTAAELEAFDRIKAEASAELDTSKLKAQLKEAQARLKELSAAEATPEVDLATAKATGEIKALQARLTELAAKHYEVEVDIDPKGLVETRLAAMAAQTDKGAGFLSRFGAAFRGVGSIAMVSLAGIVIALLPVITTLGYAAAALGALTIAAIGAAGALVPLLVGAVLALTKGLPGAEAATTALKDAFSKLGDEFKKIAAPGVIAMFRGLTPLIQSLTSNLDKLRPGLTALGQSFGQAFANARPQVTLLVGEFGKLMQATAPIAGPLISSLISLGRIITNIARAAMPMLIDGFRNLAQSLRDFANATANIQNARRIIRGWMDDLSATWGLIKAIGRAIGALFAPLAQQGKSTTQGLTDMLNKFADWANTVEGKQQIRKFFEDVGTSIKALGDLVVAITPWIVAMLEAVGKAGTLLLGLFNGLLGAIKQLPGPLQTAMVYLLGFVLIGARLATMGAALRVIGVAFAGLSYAVGLAIGMVSMLALLFAPLIGIVMGVIFVFRNFGSVISWLGGLFSTIGRAASVAFNWVRTAAVNAFNWVKSAASNAASFVANAVSKGAGAAWAWIKTAASNVFGAVRSVVSSGVSWVASAVSRAAGAAWRWILTALQTVFNTVKGVVSDAVDWIVDQINHAKQPLEDLIGLIDSAMDKVGDLVSKIADLPGKLNPFQRGGTVLRDTLALVGEAGPELVSLSAGSHVIPAGKTRQILSRAAGDEAVAGQTNQFFIETPEGDAPDAATMLAQISTKLRARGGVG